jgi:hypothetical protein
MRKLFLLKVFLIGAMIQGRSQQAYPDRLSVFIDCHNGCDMTYIRSEINIVDFLLDRQAADVHVLITDQNTGSGGDEYQLIFFGQNQFRGITDTLRFINDANNTDFEERALLLKYLKIGLTPFIARTKMGKELDIKMKIDQRADQKATATTATKDPWNFWIFRTRLFGSINAEESIKDYSYNGNLSASHITEETKLVFELYGGKNKTIFEYEDSTGKTQKEIIRNDNYELSHYLIKSISDHWSWGYEAGLSRSTRSNNKRRTLFRTGVEYNIFPYKEVNTKYFTIAYILDARHNLYFDSTLYDKINETLFGHGIETNMAFNQKWGTIELGLDYHNYFHKWKFLNLEAYLELEIRITGGLSFTVFTFGELLRDQIYLPKERASLEDVLTRRRELESGYRFGTHFGINYRFGSKLNNFVNPRFGRD